MREYITEEAEIKLSDNCAKIVRKGWRVVLSCAKGDYDIAYFIGGQIPYYYREPSKIARDFVGRRNAIEMVKDLATKAPTTPQFQQSHCGEILAALYLEYGLGFRRLYSKLTLTTAEDTNVHKMDGFFVNVDTKPFTYVAVEAKTSILPTEKTPFKGHRHGILRQIIDSLEKYDSQDERFDFTTIRDNLEADYFSREDAEQIRNDLVPPGPTKLVQLGMATINEKTVCVQDDEFILTEPCQRPFDYKVLVVSDLALLARESYAKWKK